MEFKSSFLQEAKARGFIYQGTDLNTLDGVLSENKIIAYIGFDPTAESLHVGNLTSIMLLRLLQKHGHKPIVLLGGATAKIGDPTGKDDMRNALSQDKIQKNLDMIKCCFSPYLDFSNETNAAEIVNNYDWLSQIKYLEFLAEYGKHFSINRMLTFDSVKTRLEREQPLSFLEFNYMVFQAYDFVELNKKYGCVLQCGGSDQWGNIVNGVELGRKVLGKDLFGLTTPLVTTSSGAKMGKTEKGAVWLNSDMLSAFDYWQFWRNTEDNDVGKYLRLFTDLPIAEIEELEQAEGAALNEVKKKLADETTALLHGKNSLEAIHKTVKSLYEGGTGDDLTQLPQFEIAKEVLKNLPMEDIFVNVQLCSSKSEARRLIKGGGAKIQDAVVLDAKAVISEKLLSEESIKVSFGKKKHHVIKVIG